MAEILKSNTNQQRNNLLQSIADVVKHTQVSLSEVVQFITNQMQQTYNSLQSIADASHDTFKMAEYLLISYSPDFSNHLEAFAYLANTTAKIL